MEKSNLNPTLFYLDNINKNYTKLISNNISKIFNVGLVSLYPNQEIGSHSTKNYEEIIVVLEGNPTILIDDSKEINLLKHSLILIPKFTKHNILNKTNSIAKYIYIVSK